MCQNGKCISQNTSLKMYFSNDYPVKKITFSFFVLHPNCLVLVHNNFSHFFVEFYLHVFQVLLVCNVSKYRLCQRFCPIDDLAEALYHIYVGGIGYLCGGEGQSQEVAKSPSG